MQLIDTPFFLNEENKHINNVLDLGKLNVVNMQLQLEETIEEHEEETNLLLIVKQGKVIFTVDLDRGK